MKLLTVASALLLVFTMYSVKHDRNISSNKERTSLEASEAQKESTGGAQLLVAGSYDSSPEASPVPEVVSSEVFVGKISHYSKAGCLGCPVHYDENGELFYRTATGEIFDESALTLAFNHLPLNTRVRITNLDNGKSRIARINDTGGFEKYGRIADLTVGLGNELGTKTDDSDVKIEVIE